jgi:hypothetical protein
VAGPRRFAAAGIALILGATLAFHAGAVRNELVSFDDPGMTYENPHVMGGLTREGVAWAFRLDERETYFHPLTWLSLMLDAEVFGGKPWGFHLGNVLLHGLNATLLFLLLLRTTERRAAALGAALLWVVHPLTVEAVAWVTERKAVLSTALALLAMHVWISYARERTPGRLAFATLLSAAACLAKPAMVVLPGLWLVLDVWPLGRARLPGGGGAGAVRWSRLLIEKVPAAVLGLSITAVSIASAKSQTLEGIDVPPLLLRVAHALASIPSYLGAAAWPAKLALFRPYPRGIEWGGTIAGALLVVAASVAAWRMRHRWPFGLAGWAWFLVALAPYLGLKQVGLWPAWADRFAYVPLMGLTLAVAFGLSALVERWPASWRGSLGASVAVILALGTATRAQVRVWRDSETLYEHSLGIAPDAATIQFNYGKLLLLSGRLAEGRRALERAVVADWRMKEAQCDLGVFRMLDGDLDGAASRFEMALRVDPDMAEALYNLGEIARQRGDLRRAAIFYERFLAVAPLELDPQIRRARSFLGR